MNTTETGPSHCGYRTRPRAAQPPAAPGRQGHQARPHAPDRPDPPCPASLPRTTDRGPNRAPAHLGRADRPPRRLQDGAADRQARRHPPPHQPTLPATRRSPSPTPLTPAYPSATPRSWPGTPTPAPPSITTAPAATSTATASTSSPPTLPASDPRPSRPERRACLSRDVLSCVCAD